MYKGLFMKNMLKVFGIIAVVVVIGFTVVSCGSNIDESLVGKWYIEGDTGKIIPAYEFTRDNKLLVVNVHAMDYESNKGEIITYTVGGKTKVGTAKYEITGNTLKISGAGTSGLVNGKYIK